MNILNEKELLQNINQYEYNLKNDNDKLYNNYHKSKSSKKNIKLNHQKNGYKTIKQQVEEMYNQIQKEIKEMDNDEESKKKIGYILRNFFTDEELSDNTKFGPNPIRNIINSEQKNNKNVIKPYIPELQPCRNQKNFSNPKKNEKKNIKEYNPATRCDKKKNEKDIDLQKILNICNENQKIIIRINDLYSRFLREEKLREELKAKEEHKQLKKNKNKININQKIYNNSNIYNNQINDSINYNIKEDEKDKYERFGGYKEYDEKNIVKVEDNNLNNKNINKKCINDKKDLIKILDISKDKKYIDAKKQMKKTKENCEKVNDLILEINHKIREDKKSIGNSDYKPIKKPRIELEGRAKQIIEQMKSDINFSIKYLDNDHLKIITNDNEEIK